MRFVRLLDARRCVCVDGGVNVLVGKFSFFGGSPCLGDRCSGFKTAWGCRRPQPGSSSAGAPDVWVFRAPLLSRSQACGSSSRSLVICRLVRRADSHPLFLVFHGRLDRLFTACFFMPSRGQLLVTPYRVALALTASYVEAVLQAAGSFGGTSKWDVYLTLVSSQLSLS